MRRASSALVRALAARHAMGVAAAAGKQLPAAHALRAVGSAATSTTGVLSRTWEWQNGASVRGFAAKTTDDEVEQFLEDLDDDEDAAWHVEPPNYAPPMAAVGSKAPLFTTKGEGSAWVIACTMYSMSAAPWRSGGTSQEARACDLLGAGHSFAACPAEGLNATKDLRHAYRNSGSG